MSLKFKIAFFNTILFLLIFDMIYLIVWIFSIQMNPVKAILVAGIAALLMPWVRKNDRPSGRKVVIHNFVYSFYRKKFKP